MLNFHRIIVTPLFQFFFFLILIKNLRELGPFLKVTSTEIFL